MKGQRGRKSAASLSIVPVTGIQRPEPPPEFTPVEAAVWTATVRAMKPTWFGPETHPLLSAYCFHVVTANELQAQLRTLTTGDREYRALLAALRAETKIMLAVARALRLTPRSNRYASDGRDGGRFHPRPWELDDPA
jgi:hypothetical protein